MRVSLGADSSTSLTDALHAALERRGHAVERIQTADGEPLGWADLAREAGERIAMGRADQGVLCCWTGTGVAIAANKVAGVRAALCGDAETARGARIWNDANVLCLSIRATSDAVAIEILDAWLAAEPDGSEAENIEKVRWMDLARGPL